MRWRAHTRGWLPWRRAKAELDESVLRIRSGRTTREIRLDDTRCVVTMHAWGLMRGTAVRIETDAETYTFACEGQLASHTRCASPLHRPPDLRLNESELAALLPLLPVPEPPDPTRKEFWLWLNAGRPTVAVFRAARLMLVLLVASLGSVLVPPPWGILVTLGVVVATVAKELRSQADIPARRLVIDHGQVALFRADRDRMLRRWNPAKIEVCAARWQFPGLLGHGPVDAPALVIRGMKGRALTVGAACGGTRLGREKTGPPLYLVSPSCWPDLLQALVGSSGVVDNRAQSSHRSSPSPARPMSIADGATESGLGEVSRS